jgi:hypothetical protein
VSPWDPLPTAFVLLPVGATLQAVGHLTEPLPPPWSGSRGFVPIPTFLAGRPTALWLGLPFLGVAGVMLEAWAAPRIWPYQVLIGLSALGYRAGERAAYVAERARVAADHRHLWG